MRTSEQWWQETKSSEPTLIAWLKKQYHGEVTAADRIERYCTGRLHAQDPRVEILQKIAADERRHAGWVGDLLRARGVESQVLDKPERYWDEVLGTIDDFVSAAAVAHHAEMMRLERIAVIARDEAAPFDIRHTFALIWRDEKFHAAAFGKMAGTEAVEAARPGHERGADAIGFLTAAEAA